MTAVVLFSYNAMEKAFLGDIWKPYNLQDTASPTGPRLVLMFKYKHIHLTAFSKMRVDLAAQVCTCTNNCM